MAGGNNSNAAAAPGQGHGAGRFMGGFPGQSGGFPGQASGLMPWDYQPPTVNSGIPWMPAPRSQPTVSDPLALAVGLNALSLPTQRGGGGDDERDARSRDRDRNRDGDARGGRDGGTSF